MEVEKVRYNINWKNFTKGTSFFIPALDPAEAKKKIAVTTKRLRIDTLSKIVIEDGIRGVRVWKL